MRRKRWRKLQLILIDYKQLIMNFFYSIFISTDDLTHLMPFDANVLTGFTMLLFFAAPAPRVRRE